MTPYVSRILADQVADLDRRQSELEARRADLRRPPPLPEDLASVQARFDDAYQAVGTGGAPAPLSGEGRATYRRRLAGGLQRFSAPWRDADLHALGGDAMAVAEEAILAGATAAAADRTRGDWRDPDKLREIRVTDDAGREWTEFCGDPGIWMRQFACPASCVKAFKDPATGRTLRTARRTIG